MFKTISYQIECKEPIPFFDFKEEYFVLYNKISEFILNHEKVHLTYDDPIYGLKKLVVHPYNLFGQSNNDFFTSYCEDYGEVSIFRLDRIIEIVGSGLKFIVRKDYKLEDYNLFLSKKPFKALIELKNGHTITLFLGREVKQVDNKYYEIEFQDTEKFICDLIISKVWEKIISPNWLKEKVKNRCINLIKRIEQ